MHNFKKEYICPDLTLVRFTLRDAICSSPENSSSVIDDGGDWGGGGDLDDLDDLD